LGGIETFAALEFRIISLTARRNRHLVDTCTNIPICVIRIPHIGTSSDGGRNGGRIRERFETGTRLLSRVGTLAAQKLGCVSSAAVGNRHFIGTCSIGPSKGKVGIPDVGTSSDGGRNSGRIREGL